MSGLKGLHRVAVGFVVALFLGAGPAWASVPFQRGMVSITLDDGWPSQFTAARPALNAPGVAEDAVWAAGSALVRLALWRL